MVYGFLEPLGIIYGDAYIIRRKKLILRRTATRNIFDPKLSFIICKDKILFIGYWHISQGKEKGIHLSKNILSYDNNNIMSIKKQGWQHP